MSQKINEHLRFLNQETSTIAAGTEDEYQAAEYISRIFKARGLYPEIEEFGIAPKARLYKSIAYILIFVGALMSGIPVGFVKIIGMLLLLISATLILVDELKTPIFSKIGPMAASQNVVAKHEGVGEKAGRGVRPIVIVAHYDTPQESYLTNTGYGHVLPLFVKATFWTTIAALGLGLFKLLFPVNAVYNTLWVLSFICAVVPLAYGIITIIDMNAPYTHGANNNKASLAAMFNILDRVEGHSSDDMYESLGITIKENKTDQFDALTDEQIEADAAARSDETIVADMTELVDTPAYTHYGEEAIRMLGILPEDCEIIYDYPEEVDIDGTQPIAVENKKSPAITPADSEWGETEFEPLPDNFTRKSALVDLPDPQGQSIDGLASEDDEVVTQFIPDQDGFTTITAADLEMENDVENATDSKWIQGAKKFGKTFKDWKASRSEKKDWKGGATPNGKFKVIGGNEVEEKEEKPTLEQMQAAIMNLANEDENASVVDMENNIDMIDSEHPQTAEEIVEMIMDEVVEDVEDNDEDESSIEDDLICHDIWFVALGSSEEGHRGMEEFLAEHRKELRGAFLVNLDGIGSGELTLITEEGFHNTRRADRRVSRLIKNVAKDMELPLATASFSHLDTDATPAMRTSLRCVTLMGMTSEGKAQYGSVLDNDLTDIDNRQIAETSYLVEEMIRRS